MTRLSKSNEDVRKGAWAAEEDEKLRKYVETYGTGHWRSVGKKAGIVTGLGSWNYVALSIFLHTRCGGTQGS